MDNELNFEDALNSMLATTVSEAVGEGVIVTKWVLLAEVVDAQAPSLITATSSHVSPWDISGMLSLAQQQAQFDYLVANSISFSGNEDDEDED